MDILILVLGMLIVLLVAGNLYLYRALKRVKSNLNSLQAQYDELKASDEILNTKYLNATFEIQEEERKRIASDLHDEIGSNLTALKYNIQALTKKGVLLSYDQDIEDVLFQDINNALDEIIVRNKEIIYGISPAVLEQFGLEVAIESLFKRTNQSYRIITQFTKEGDVRYLSPKQELMIYRIIQELLNNAMKYSNRWQFAVHLNWKAEKFELNIREDGRINKQTNSKGIGFYNIRNRVKLLGGNYEQQENIAGIEIMIRVPYDS